jgi:hypothetical protein
MTVVGFHSTPPFALLAHVPQILPTGRRLG